jgi:hypothetical protein
LAPSFARTLAAHPRFAPDFPRRRVRFRGGFTRARGNHQLHAKFDPAAFLHGLRRRRGPTLRRPVRRPGRRRRRRPGPRAPIRLAPGRVPHRASASAGGGVATAVAVSESPLRCRRSRPGRLAAPWGTPACTHIVGGTGIQPKPISHLAAPWGTRLRAPGCMTAQSSHWQAARRSAWNISGFCALSPPLRGRVACSFLTRATEVFPTQAGTQRPA